MHEDAIHPPAGDVSAGHEPAEIDTRPLRITAIVLLLCGIAIPLALLWLFKVYERTAVYPEANAVHSEVRSAGPSAPEPRVQGIPTFHGQAPRADMEQLRRESEERLNSYGKGEEVGFVRIPIDRAMQIMAERQARPTTQRSR
ncbi:MAG TPA: hypothetical protein VGQ99_20390 [Tepidisphaeraceae bacterium]|jgi:hypothetical protein|nr:hypothetical protein [Tepidisphaeraceae bacterium]